MKKVAFQFHAPGAKEVLLAGDFTQWEKKPKKMTRKRGQSGLFTTSLELPLGTHEYKFIVDGMWHEDPSAASAANSFGSHNSVIEVSERQ